MRTYHIPIIYQRMQTVEVIANSLQEASTMAVKQFLSEPDDDYICDSWELDDVYVREQYDEPLDNDKLISEL